MKLITLNTWCGRKMEEFEKFLIEHNDIDVFCFQEVYHEAHGKDEVWKDGSNFNFLNDVKKILSPNYNFYYKPHLDDWWGIAIFIKKDFNIIEEGDFFIHKKNGYNPDMEVYGYTAKNIQFLKTKYNNKIVTILNLHGLWNGNGKDDTEDRIEQSKNIVEFIKNIDNDYILCGDFNLLPESKSLMMIEEKLGCIDLIKKYGITSTRTSLYLKPIKFADYVFVSKGIDVIDFKVLPDEVSDHAPLLLDFK
jgi:exonuclease III